VQGIDAVITDVNSMLQSVKDVSFSIFDRDLSLEWQTVVRQFRTQNEKAKDATRNLIDTSFRRLRSAEGAFELLQNFKKIESKGAIKEQMASKKNDILEQFSREVDAVSDIFESQRYGSLF
jgi:dynein heavy chain, axonemal